MLKSKFELVGRGVAPTTSTGLAWLSRSALAAIVGSILCLAGSRAQACVQTVESPGFVPGQEELAATMLGRGVLMPNDCMLVGAGFDHSILKATYACADGEVNLQICHLSEAPEATLHTSVFAITVEKGSPSNEFTTQLSSQVSASESHFEWIWP